MNKVKILILSVLFLFGLCVFADEASICSTQKMDESIISNITGTNFLMTKTVETAIQNSLNRQLRTNVNVEIKAFGAKSFVDGKFKSMELDAKTAYLDGTYISDFKAKSVCEYNQVKVKDNELLFLENFVMNFSGKMTDDDLRKTLITDSFLNKINRMSINTQNVTFFKVLDPKVSIEGDKVHYSLQILAPVIGWFSPKKVEVTAGLEVKNGKLALCNVKINPCNKMVNLNTITPILNMINPFVFNAKLSNKTASTIILKCVKIENDEIRFSGVSIVGRNKVTD